MAVVELSDSDTDEENLTSEDDSESEDDCITGEVTIDNIKFPKPKGEKGKIEILDSKVNEWTHFYYIKKKKSKPHFLTLKTSPLNGLVSPCEIPQDPMKCYRLHGGVLRIHSALKWATSLKN